MAVLSQLQDIDVETLWTAFGHDVGKKWIQIHEPLNAIGPARASGLMYFHGFTGCDVVCAFRGKGEKSAWQTWDVFDVVTETFSNLSQFPTEVTYTDLKTLERFVFFSCMTGPVQSLVWTKRGCTCLPASSDHMFPFHQPKQLYGTMLSLMQASSGGQATYADPDIGSPADWDWRPNVRARKAAPEGANAFVLNLPVQHSATARVNSRTVRKTTAFQLVQYMCSNGQLSNILYRFACGCWQ